MASTNEVLFCNICLRINITQKYYLKDKKERQFMEGIFKENGLLKKFDGSCYACFECKTILYKSYNFFQKALRAQTLLCQLVYLKKKLTIESLSSIDRNKYGITSTLACSAPETYFIDSNLIGNKDKEKLKVLVKEESNETVNDSLEQVLDHVEEKVNNRIYEDGIEIILTPSNSTEVNQLTKPVGEDPFAGIHINPVIIKNEGVGQLNSVKFNIDPNICTKNDPESVVNHLEITGKSDSAGIEIIENDTASNKLAFIDLHEDDEIVDYEPLDEYDDSSDLDSDTDIVKIKKRLLKIKKFNESKTLKQKNKVSKNINTKWSGKLNKQDTEKSIEITSVNKVTADPDVSNIIEGRFRTRQKLSYVGLDVKKGEDEEFVVQSDLDDSSSDSCDENASGGRRVFPMECEEMECKSIVMSKTEHYYHYLHQHRGVEYPYKRSSKSLLCQDCGEYVTERQLKTHRDKHSGKMHKCKYCSKDFSSDQTRQHHARRVHGITRKSTVKRHQCDYCKKIFFEKSDLRIHMRTHTGEKPFKCHLCEYRCAHKGNIHSHIRQFHQHMQPRKQKPVEKKKKRKKTKS